MTIDDKSVTEMTKLDTKSSSLKLHDIAWLGDVIMARIFSFRLNFYCFIVVKRHDRNIEHLNE